QGQQGTVVISKRRCKTYSSRDSHVVTHRSTNLPFNCLCMAERTDAQFSADCGRMCLDC
ncbi:hypothetical protein M438DRAFT_279490, partial [Aureobasidium pullulans EXF-150]